MATKVKQKPAVKQSNGYEQAAFIRRELTPEEQAICKAWELSSEDCWDSMQRFVENGYRVTARWDDYNECFACWLLPPREDKDNAGLILTGRGSSPYKAFKQACFKHYQLFQEVWPKEVDKRGGNEIDD